MKSYFYGWVNYQNGLLLDEDKENINKNFSCNWLIKYTVHIILCDQEYWTIYLSIKWHNNYDHLTIADKK